MSLRGGRLTSQRASPLSIFPSSTKRTSRTQKIPHSRGSSRIYRLPALARSLFLCMVVLVSRRPLVFTNSFVLKTALSPTLGCNPTENSLRRTTRSKYPYLRAVEQSFLASSSTPLFVKRFPTNNICHRLSPRCILNRTCNTKMRHEHSFLRSSPGSRRRLQTSSVDSAEGSIVSGPEASGTGKTATTTALIVLNMPIKATLSMPHEYTEMEEALDGKPPNSLFERLWRASDFRVCADGGANRLYDATILPWSHFQGKKGLDEKVKMENPYLPNAIVGDLDSIRPEVKEYYQKYGHGLEHGSSTSPKSCSSSGQSGLSSTHTHGSHVGCRIVRNPDENCNDFDKSLQYILAQQEETMSKSKMDHASLAHDTCFRKWKVYVYGAFDGRFDQTMASIQALYKWQNTFECLVLYNEDTSARLLSPHVTNHIKISHDFEGPSCGLLPIGSKCEKITTTGLKWNLEAPHKDKSPGAAKNSMEFGGLISTSNRIVADSVTVTCSHPVVWTTEIKSHAGKS